MISAAARALVAGIVMSSVFLIGDAGAASRLRGQNFFSNCYLSHIASDDPIVYPGQPGVSHSHSFFGAKSTNAASTARSLRASATTCRRSADTAAYWVPTLYSGGKVVKPTKGSAYFVIKSRGGMHAFPAGLKIVAGDSHARFPQSLDVVFWSCSQLEGIRYRWTTPHSCANAGGSSPQLRQLRERPLFVQLDVIFPDCWDGRRLDSPDHKSHLAYSRNWVCPRSHPVHLPRLRFIVTYPIQTPRSLAFASGGIYSAHADYLNAWKQAALRKLVADCFNYRPACNLPPK